MKVLVFVDCIEGWQECSIIKTLDDRAIVKTKTGTVVNRILKTVKIKNELVPDRCIYILNEDS